MLFSAEWTANAPNISPEERATLCRLRIFVGRGNACAWEDPDTGEASGHLALPAVHLAQGIAADWWSIFGSRGQPARLRRHLAGFALPDLRLSFDGKAFCAETRRITYQNPRLQFTQELSETTSRHEAERALSGFVQEVIGRLEKNGIRDSEVSTRWSRVTRSREDPGETGFCEAAGALGVDPYSIRERDALFIEDAGRLLSGEKLTQLMARSRAGRNSRP